jgi:glycosyltransferase involved in cell wall biosynthesis
MADRVRPKLPRGVAPTLLPLWKDVGEIVPVSRAANPLAAEWDVGDRFVLMYSGNAGLGHRFEEVKALLRHFRGDPGMLTLFVGGGSRRRELEHFIADERIDNARYLDYVPRDQVRWTLPLADAHLVTLQPSWSGIAVPSKIFGILASARPAAMVGPEDSEVARIIAESGAGRVIIPGGSGSAADLIEFIETLRRDPGMREEMGQRGRRALEKTYTLDAGLDRWEVALNRTLSG